MRAPVGLEARTVVVDGETFLVLSHPWRRSVRVEAIEGLTDTERDIAERLLAGEAQAEIAKARGTSARTVANQIASIYRKAGVTSRVELALRCR